MNLLLDMNPPPAWVAALAERGWSASHWSAVGDPRASDEEIMAEACQRGEVILTLDLDFSRILALTRAIGPSVVQIRAMDVLSETTATQVADGLDTVLPELKAGALVVIEPGRNRLRVLPLRT